MWGNIDLWSDRHGGYFTSGVQQNPFRAKDYLLNFGHYSYNYKKRTNWPGFVNQILYQKVIIGIFFVLLQLIAVDERTQRWLGFNFGLEESKTLNSTNDAIAN